MYRSLIALLIVYPLMAQTALDVRKNAQIYAGEMHLVMAENIGLFWLDKSLDRANGGYLISFDEQSKPLLPAPKGIVSQARNVWLFSQMYRRGYYPERSREAARIGYEFLRDKLWDATNGGFYWEVDAVGKPTKPMKHMYGNSFGLYAVAEYAMAFDDSEARAFATKIFDTFEAKSHDGQYGGYIEFFNPDWSAVATGSQTYMSDPVGIKLMNTHLHLMEAMTTYYRAVPSPLARERLIELINIETNTVVRKDIGACTDKFARNWKPLLQGDYARASYGHDLENVWLIMDAVKAAGLSDGPFRDLYERLWAYSLKYGYDEKEGGFYYYGPLGASATNLEKSWWVQAEVLVSSLRMYRLTGDAKYWQVFEKTWVLVRDKFVDRTNGEWYPGVRGGKASGAKGNVWKAGYHNGRAMLESIALLRSMRE